MTDKNQDERLEQLMREFSGEIPVMDRVEETEIGHEELYDSQSRAAQNIEILKEQILELQEEMTLQRETNTQKNNTSELTALQAMYASHAGKIEDLQQQQELLTTVAASRSDKKQSGFGKWGWVFLSSNVLLWSVLTWFLWAHYRGDFANNFFDKNSLVKENDYSGMTPLEDEETASGDSQNDSELNETESSNGADILNADNQRSTNQLTNSASITQANADAEMLNNKPANQNITSTSNYAQDKYEGLTQAQIYYKKLSEEKNQRAENKATRIAKSRELDSKNRFQNNQTNGENKDKTSENPPVRFGD